MSNFGKTWWGAQWLNSLSNIDYSNRLPRGSSYARKGAVTSISINDNKIFAKVAGSQPKPYDVTIIIPPFFEPEIKKLIKAVSGKPAIISRLLNRELDPEILSIAEQCGLKVFPRQWTDFKMQCSCPDWAVPCKHLAAVIYKVSAEIDNNPFLAFSLHCVDLPAELKKQSIHIRQPNEEEVPLFKNLILPLKKERKKNREAVKGQEPGSVKANPYQKISLSSLSPIHEPLIRLLPDAPVFYQNSGNFRDKYSTGLRKVVRIANRIVQDKTNIEDFFPRIEDTKVRTSSFAITHHTGIFIKIDENNNADAVLSNAKKPLPLADLIPDLWQIPPAHLQDYQSSVAWLKNTLLLAMNLAANGAMVPQVIRMEKTYTIRWLPAMVSKEVKVLVEKIEDALPDNLVYYDESPIHTHGGFQLLSAMLNILVHKLSEKQSGDIFYDLFFSNFSFSFNGPGQHALPGGIQQWLSLYYLTEGNYKPVLTVEELRQETFQINLNIQDVRKPLEKPIPLQEVLTLKKFEQQRFDILQSLAQLNSFIPGLDHCINSQGAQPIRMNIRDFTPFLMQAVPAIQLLDISLLLPKSLQHILKPKASLRIKKKTKEEQSFIRLDQLLAFDWQVAVGDTVMDQKEFQKLVEKSDGLIKYKSNYIYVSPEDLEKLHKHFSAMKELKSFDLLRAALSNDYNGARISLTDDVKKMIAELTEQKTVALPENIQAMLRPYQHRGFSWMFRNARIGFGSVLADDMGLGKTLQVITTLVKFKEEGFLQKAKALVVAPTGLLTNWQAEIEKFAPGLKCHLYHGPSRKLDKNSKYDILLTSYGIVRSDASTFKKLKWQVVVADEAQNLKNQETAQSKAMKSIPANTFIAMSGTPVENRLTELWSIMDFCNRGSLGSIKDFKENYALPIQNQNDLATAEKLKTVTAPFLMRRLKSDKSIISDLPDKVEMDFFCSLTKEQASLYEKTMRKAMEDIEGIQKTDQKALFVRQGLVLQMIMALKQICNHPSQFLKNKILNPALSGKTELLFEKLESILESNEKVLVFTQFKEMGDLLKRFIAERFGEEPLFYHGGCSLKQRKEMVESFQTNPADKIFILSLKAAGTGLNLTAANHVVHYDLWWNPAVEAQATDRAYRIGQKNNVMVHRFITKGTFEERINEMIQRKKHLANLTVATGENWIGNLSNKELKDLFELS